MKFSPVLFSISMAVVGCVSSSTEVSSALDSERCGTLLKKNSSLEFQDGVSGKNRSLEIGDKSLSVRLEGFVTSKQNVCITADWTAAKDVVLTSSRQVREADLDQATEECGTIEEQSDGFYLVLHGGESKGEGLKKLHSVSPKVQESLQSSALEERCIKANFKVNPIEISSPDQIRPWVK